VLTDVEPPPAGQPVSRRRWPHVLSILIAVVAWVLVAAGLFGLIARTVVSSWHPLIIAATALPFISAGVLVAVLGFGATRRWLPLGISVVLLVVLAVPQARILVRSPGRPVGTPLRIMTFNMRLGDADVHQVLATARSHGAQLLMLQELSYPALQRLRAAGIDTQFRYSYANARGGGSGIGLFSVVPLADEHNYPDFWLQVISARITLPSGPSVTVFSSHLSAPYPAPAGRWVLESRHLGQVLAGITGPVVDAGDFNSTVNHKTFRELVAAGGMTDAASSIGAVLRTYPVDRWPGALIGIDHVLLRDVQARSVKSVHIDNSDHAALVATLGVR
jgi:endonuclease/exonuclease/phosphatase (EEP) superfamily protein YafD